MGKKNKGGSGGSNQQQQNQPKPQQQQQQQNQSQQQNQNQNQQKQNQPQQQNQQTKQNKPQQQAPQQSQQPQPKSAAPSTEFKFDFGVDPKATTNNNSNNNSAASFKFDFGVPSGSTSGTTLGGSNPVFTTPSIPQQQQQQPHQQQSSKRKGVPQKRSAKQEEEDEEEEEEEEEEQPRGGHSGRRQDMQQLLAAMQQGPGGGAMMQALQKRMAEIIGQNSGYVDNLPKEVKRRIGALKKLHDEHSSIQQELSREIAELERKYESKFKPLYEKRTTIVTGQHEPTDDEIKQTEEEEQEGRITEIKDEEEEKPKEPTKGIPDFWLGVLENHPEIAEIIQEEDREALSHLIDIRTSPVTPTDLHSFSVEFVFEDNPFFSDKVLKKTFYLKEDKLTGEIDLDQITGTDVQWKPNKNLTIVRKKKKVVPRKGGRMGPKAGRKGSMREKAEEIWVEEPKASFFNFFSSEATLAVLAGQEENEEFDEEEAIQDIQERDYDLGLELKEKVIPNAILYFTGEASNQMFDDENEDDDYGEEEEDDFNDEDEDQDEDFQPPPAGQECKQQ